MNGGHARVRPIGGGIKLSAAPFHYNRSGSRENTERRENIIRINAHFKTVLLHRRLLHMCS